MAIASPKCRWAHRAVTAQSAAEPPWTNRSRTDIAPTVRSPIVNQERLSATVGKLRTRSAATLEFDAPVKSIACKSRFTCSTDVHFRWFAEQDITIGISTRIIIERIGYFS